MDKTHLSYAALLFFNGFGILVLRCSVLENYAWNLRNASLIWQERFFLPITKMGIILTFSNQKGCCNVVRSVLLYFERKENQSFIFVSGGLFQLSYFTKLSVLFHRGRYETILKKILRNWSAQPVLNENMSQLFPKYLS